VILGVIPARGGSKGIPRKNLKKLCGKPLVVWTIEAAKKSKLLDRFVVSTEDEEIAEVSRKYGAEIADRPPELAKDETPILVVLQDILKKIDADVVVLLNPTSPIRNPGLIDRCIRRFLDSAANSLATGFMCKYKEYGTYDGRRQDIEGFFYDDGNIYITKADLVRKGNRFGKKIERVILDKEQNVDIDDDFDFWLTEQILKKRLAHSG
jgi:CMP-N-acetylneuraminic acid synthetase